jgi:hypothetical protein
VRRVRVLAAGYFDSCRGRRFQEATARILSARVNATTRDRGKGVSALLHGKRRGGFVAAVESTRFGFSSPSIFYLRLLFEAAVTCSP